MRRSSHGSSLIPVSILAVLLMSPQMVVFGQNWISADAIQDLPEKDRPAVVLAMLQQRDDRLKNLSYSIDEYVTTVSDGKRAPGSRSTFELKRINTSYIYSVKRLEPDGATRAESRSNWDGKLRRSLAETPSGIKSGVVSDREVDFVHDSFFNEAIGFRKPGSSETMTSWLRAAVTSMPVTVETVRVDGTALVTMAIKESEPQSLVLYFDPHRDYLNVKSEYVIKNGEDFGRARMTVLEAKQVGNTWLPAKLLRVNSLSDHDGYDAEFQYSLSEASIGTVRPTDLTIDFPVGAHVIDAIERVNYVVGPNHTRTYKPLYDPVTGKVTTGPPTTITKPTGS